MTGSGNHTYLIAGAGGSALLIDAGVGDAGHLAAIAVTLNTVGARLEHVLISHAHGDHASGAVHLLQEHVGSRAYKYPWPEADAPGVVSWQPLRDGDVFGIDEEELVVVHTPGHTPDHVAFWHEASRTVFTGDLMVAGSSVMIDWSGGGDLAQYLASLERVLALGPRRLLPAHGPEVADPAALLQGYLDHRRARERQVIAALAAGRTSVQQIAEYIYHGLDPALLPAAQQNVRAHLEKLKSEGRAFEDNATWTTSSTSST